MNSHLIGALHGLMLGEALSWTSLYQRSLLLPYWTRRKRREIATQYEEDKLIEVSLPFALNQPTDSLVPGPGLHSEWIAFQLDILRQGQGRYVTSKALAAWNDLLEQRETLRLTLSQRAALENLAQGKRPPFSGHDNPHYFDDSACFRAIPLAALMATDPAALAACVAEDATITQAQDGLWGAQAYATALATITATSSVETSLGNALAHLPQDSWIGHSTRVALAAADDAKSLFTLIAQLSQNISNHAYNYGNSAPETVAITFAIFKFTQGNLNDSLLGALALPRTAGSVAPLVGALCGALNPQAAGAAAVFGSTLTGVSLPMFKGVDLMTLLDFRDLEPST